MYDIQEVAPAEWCSPEPSPHANRL